MIRVPSRLSALLFCNCIAAAALPLPFVAPVQAQEVVQALPDPATETLNDALRRLSRNPESVPALVAAGRASLDLNDVSAALGFFSRAQAVAPEDGRVLVGLALVAVRRGEAVTALQLFRNAEAAGERMAPHAADHGLAYDLVGRNGRAQRLYRLALSQDESPEVLRRLALSYAIAGNADASEATLLPLLQRQDRAAYRTRAFALAIRGRDEEAIAIAETMLPQRLSLRLAPYLRYMPRLTRAQQAAAANLGHFPAANEVGRDTAEIAAYAGADGTRAGPTPTRQTRAAERLEPRGEPLGPAIAQAPSEQAPAVEQEIAAAEIAAEETAADELPPVAASAPPSPTPATPAPVGELPALSEVADDPVTRPRVRQDSTVVATLGDGPQFPDPEEARPSFSLTETPGSNADAPEPRTAGEAAPETIDLAEAFSDFTLESSSVPSTQGAVDITTIVPPRERPEPEAPPPPAHPARHWVQVATGQDTSAFRFDWRRIVRNSDGLLDDAEAFTAPWGQTNRLLTGPFDSADEAQDMVSSLAGEGVDSFRFSSREGDEIQSLD